MICAVCKAKIVRYVEKKQNGEIWKLGYCANNHVQICERIGCIWTYAMGC